MEWGSSLLTHISGTHMRLIRDTLPFRYHKLNKNSPWHQASNLHSPPPTDLRSPTRQSIEHIPPQPHIQTRWVQDVGTHLIKYDPRGRETLFESVSALYALEKGPTENISDYMSHDHRLFRSLQGIPFHTIENIFFIVNSDRARFVALADFFQYGYPEVAHSNVYRIKILLESIESCSRVVDGLPTSEPYALHGSATKPDTTPDTNPDIPPNSDRPKPTAPPRGTCTSYPPSCPKWDEITNLFKVENFFCACFCAHMWAQGCIPLANVGLVISKDLPSMIPPSFIPVNP